MRPGRRKILALDLGDKRIGVAASDETCTIARSLAVLNRASRLADFEKISQIVDEQGVNLLVVGLPIESDGTEGARAAWTRDYTAALSAHLGLPAEFWDESFTTVEAEDSLRARGIHGRKRRQRVDVVAAAFILQNYLDAHKD